MEGYSLEMVYGINFNMKKYNQLFNILFGVLETLLYEQNKYLYSDYNQKFMSNASIKKTSFPTKDCLMCQLEEEFNYEKT